jgi:beta-lactamase superfamily II metal-dependent hydrolase
MMFGGAMISVLHPRRGFFSHDRQAYSAENNRSLVVQIRSEGRGLLFMGDVGIEVERNLMMSMRGMKTDLIKVPHHGSKSSSSEDFVLQTKPAVAVMTVGRGNPYHHPSDEVLERYEKIRALICRTDSDGAVTIAVNKGELAIQRWNDLVLRRIALADRATWGEQELVNGDRLRIRALGL